MATREWLPGTGYLHRHRRPALETHKGDVFDTDSVADALAGQDAAIVCLGPIGLRDKTTLSAGTAVVIDAMTKHDVQRLIVMSAAGVGDSWKQIPRSSRLLFRTMLRVGRSSRASS